MKTALLSVLFVLVTFTAHAAYDIQMKLSKGGRLISESRIVVNEGDEGSIVKRSVNPSLEDTFFEVVATPHSRGIALTIVSGMMDAEGTRNVVGKSELIVGNGKTVSTTVGNLSNPSEKVTLTVTPKIIPNRKN